MAQNTTQEILKVDVKLPNPVPPVNLEKKKVRQWIKDELEKPQKEVDISIVPDPKKANELIIKFKDADRNAHEIHFDPKEKRVIIDVDKRFAKPALRITVDPEIKGDLIPTINIKKNDEQEVRVSKGNYKEYTEAKSAPAQPSVTPPEKSAKTDGKGLDPQLTKINEVIKDATQDIETLQNRFNSKEGEKGRAKFLNDHPNLRTAVESVKSHAGQIVKGNKVDSEAKDRLHSELNKAIELAQDITAKSTGVPKSAGTDVTKRLQKIKDTFNSKDLPSLNEKPKDKGAMFQGLPGVEDIKLASASKGIAGGQESDRANFNKAEERKTTEVAPRTPGTGPALA